MTLVDHALALYAEGPPETCLDLLGRGAASDLDVYLHERAGSEERRTYPDLLRGACDLASALVARDMRPGDRIACVLTTSFEAIEAFFAVQLLGAIPVPIAPPGMMASPDAYRQLTAGIVSSLGIRLALGGLCRIAPRAPSPEPGEGFRAWFRSDELGPGRRGAPSLRCRSPNAIAYTQCPSGSTSLPKGVMLSHRALVANVAGINLAMAAATHPDDAMLSWLPLHHDMGLIGGVLTSLAAPRRLVLVPPQTFMFAPTVWLDAIPRHRASILLGPCFGFSLVTRRFQKRETTADLSSVRAVIVGAEPISPAIMDEFTARFARNGLDPRALMPSYGLAESCVAVTLTPPMTGMHVDRIARDKLNGSTPRAVPATDGETASFVACGRPIETSRVWIAGPNGERLDERAIGHICVEGRSLMDGYLDAAEATAEALRDGVLYTGDLGYIADGELYIVGRAKEMLIVRGRNYYPEDIEAVVDAVEGVRVGKTVAFGVHDRDAASDLLYLAVEHNATTDEQQTRLVDEIARQVNESIGIRPHVIRLLPVNSLPRTTSGKKQRSRARELLGVADRRWLA